MGASHKEERSLSTITSTPLVLRDLASAGALRSRSLLLETEGIRMVGDEKLSGSEVEITASIPLRFR